jgi:hypothetical protein
MEDTPSGRPSGGRGMMPIGLVALAAIVYSLAPGGGMGRRDAGGSAAQERRGEALLPEEDPLTPVYQFLDVQRGKPGPGSLTRESGLIRRYRVQFLIATLPDPVDSHLAQLFDRGVSAIAGSVQEAGFVLDRFSLPWKRDSSTRWDLNLPDRKDSGQLVSLFPKKTSSDLHRRVPGTILFRAEDQLVVVFLVGETPTSGIQREALSSALCAVETFQAKVGPQVAYPESDEIKILGPYFSGTTESLRNALIAWAKTSTRRVRMVSGSATVDTNYKKLNISAPTAAPTVDTGSAKTDGLPQISFQATVIPDNVLKWHFFDFLKDELGAKLEDDVALFVEGGTSYGRNFAKESTSDHLEPRFVISFPLHVSQLRAAYERDEALRNPGGASRVPRHSLELALDSPDQDSRDVLRAQDPGTALNIADLVISHSIETIRREGIRFVGILASDPRDVLFLSRKIREAGASVTLFTFGTDILLTHSDYERYLRGMFVVSPYPLFPVNQAWTGTRGARLAFAGASEEGIYNAVQYLVDWTPSATQPHWRPPLVDYRRPDRPGPRRPRPDGADTRPSRERRPPIWIMAVGRGGFWPVNYFPRYTSSSRPKSGEPNDLAEVAEAYVLKDPTETEPTRDNKTTSREAHSEEEGFDYHPPGAAPAFMLIEIVVVVLILVYGFVRLPLLSRVSPQVSKRLSIVCERILWVKEVPDALDANQTYLVCAALLLATVQAAIVVTLFGMKAFLDEHRPALVVSLLLLLCLVGIAGRDLVGLFRRAREEGGSRPARLGVVVALVYLAGALFIVFEYVLEVKGEGWSETLASYVRTLDFTSGISPVLPFLFAILVLCLWVACNLQRAFLLEVHANAWPSSERTTLVGFRDIYESIQSLLADPVRRFAMLLVPLLVLLPASRVFSRGFDTIDGDHWSGVWLFLFLSCFVSILYAVALFLALWVRLRRFLRRLAWHPAAEAFRRLPEALGTTPWRMWRTVPSLTALEASVSQLRLIVNAQKADDSDRWKSPQISERWKTLRIDADNAAELLNRAFTVASTSFAASLPAQRELRQLLAKAFDLVVEELEDVWARWPGAGDRIEELRRAGAKEQFLDVAAWVRRGIPAPVDVWFRAAEEFFAIRMSSVIRYVFLQMKNLLSFSFLGFIFLIAAINAYPFEPFHSVMALIWVVGVVGLAAIGWVLVGMNRDRILSYIGKTKPGEVSISAEFVTTMTIYIIVPLLTLLATQFPGIGDFVFSVFTPAMRSVR